MTFQKAFARMHIHMYIYRYIQYHMHVSKQLLHVVTISNIQSILVPSGCTNFFILTKGSHRDANSVDDEDAEQDEFMMLSSMRNPNASDCWCLPFAAVRMVSRAVSCCRFHCRSPVGL